MTLNYDKFEKTCCDPLAPLFDRCCNACESCVVAMCGCACCEDSSGDLSGAIGSGGDDACDRVARRCPDAKRVEGAVLVVTVSCIIGGAYFVVMYLVLDDAWLPLRSVSGVLVRAWITLLLAMIFVAYYAAVRSDAGVVEYGWERAAALSLPPSLDVADTLATCARCGVRRPPRTHHCSVLRACVLRMDHYCPFIANCVGAFNVKAFLLFLIYATLGLANGVALIAWRTLDMLRATPASREMPYGSKIAMLCAGALLLPLTAAVGALAGFQLHLASRNMTSIEAARLDAARRRVRREQGREAAKALRNELDRGGARVNLAHVFNPLRGSTLRCWWPYNDARYDLQAYVEIELREGKRDQ